MQQHGNTLAQIYNNTDVQKDKNAESQTYQACQTQGFDSYLERLGVCGAFNHWKPSARWACLRFFIEIWMPEIVLLKTTLALALKDDDNFGGFWWPWVRRDGLLTLHCCLLIMAQHGTHNDGGTKSQQCRTNADVSAAVWSVGWAGGGFTMQWHGAANCWLCFPPPTALSLQPGAT